MNKDYFFDKIMDLVTETMGISKDDIISTNKKMSVIDARSMVVYFAYKVGLPQDYIRKRLQRNSHNSIPNLLETYYKRSKSSYFHYLSMTIARSVENIMSANCQ